jgi:AbrB family looped-hinge helix DNA binding protein
MKTTIDAAGRLVIPRDIRRLAGIEAGATLDVSWRDGHIEIEPATLPVRLVEEGRLLVALPEAGVPPLSSDAVNAALDSLRRERDGLG